MARPKVSLVTVVKNEEPVIGRLLDSVQGKNRFWDELVVTDTGSTDRTVEIAEAHGARVVRTQWPDSFGAARNMGADNASPDTDVIVIFDGDDVLGAGGDLLRERIDSAWSRGKRVMSLRYEFAHDETGRASIVYPRQAIYDPKSFRWRGRVHEALEGPLNAQTLEYFPDVTLEHWPKAGWSAAKRGRDLGLLKLELADRPNDPRVRFYLGREYYYNELFEDAIATLRSYLEIAHWKPERMDALLHIARCEFARKRRHEGCLAAMEAILEMPNRREPLMMLCQLHYAERDWRGTIVWGEAAVAIPFTDQRREYILSEPDYTWLPHDLLSVAYWNLKEPERGLEHLRKALSFRPDDERLKANLKWFS